MSHKKKKKGPSVPGQFLLGGGAVASSFFYLLLGCRMESICTYTYTLSPLLYLSNDCVSCNCPLPFSLMIIWGDGGRREDLGKVVVIDSVPPCYLTGTVKGRGLPCFVASDSGNPSRDDSVRVRCSLSSSMSSAATFLGHTKPIIHSASHKCFVYPETPHFFFLYPSFCEEK